MALNEAHRIVLSMRDKLQTTVSGQLELQELQDAFETLEILQVTYPWLSDCWLSSLIF
jgi:hypothetical protein